MHPLATRGLTAAATAVVLGGTVLALLSHDRPDAAPIAALSALSLVAAGLGWAIVRSRPWSAVGPALAWSSAAVVLVFLVDLLSSRWEPARLVDVGVWPVNLAGVFALLLVFPDAGPRGRRRALPIAYALATVGVVASSWGAVQVDGQVVDGDSGPASAVVGAVSMLVLAACLITAVVGVVQRYRAGAERQRVQIRWLMLAGVAVVGLLLAGWAALALGAPIALAFTPFLVAILVGVPAAVAVAVLRHDLFDVDRLLNGTASWVVTLVVAAAVFGAVVVGFAAVIGNGTTLGSAAAAFVSALVLVPLHQVVVRAVGRVVDRDRHVGEERIRRFAADVAIGRREAEEIEEVLRAAQGDPELRVLLMTGDGGWTGLDGTPAEPGAGVTVESMGHPVARITLGRESVRARRRIDVLARAAWVPIEVARLRFDLRHALHETRASRTRLMEAVTAERRRLEHDLHDGAQQHLLATGMRLRMLQLRVDPAVAAELDLAVGELENTVGELRRLSRGLRPSRLDDGLAAALDTLRAESPLPFTLAVGELPDLDESRAVTAYLVVAEALANVIKHAGASLVDVRVSGEHGRLRVEVRDDGVGGVDAATALRSLRDRVLSVDGVLEVVSPAGLGTSIRAVL